MSEEQNLPIRVAVLGAGGLGRAAARIIGMKRELILTAMCDSSGIVASSSSLNIEALVDQDGDLVSRYRKAMSVQVNSAYGSSALEPGGAVAVADDVKVLNCDDPLGEMLNLTDQIDAVLVALPNLPNEFIPNVIERFAQASRSLVFVDVLKRTSAVRQMLLLDKTIKQVSSVVLTGCGATPGFLAAAAVLAAQSFISVEKVDICWGVGIANWDTYKATIREDIAHLPGFDLERAKAMTDQEIDRLLDSTSGILELRNMEHADDELLMRAGVVDRPEQVEVGGVMDTRNCKKPVSTTMTLTGITFDGKRSSHRFILGDETTMAANVIGPALGYLKRGLWLKAHGIYGVFGSTEFLPMVVK